MASMGAVMQRDQYSDLFASLLPYLRRVLYEQFDAPSLTYTRFFKVLDSDRYAEETTGITGFSQFVVKPEGEKVTYDQQLQGYDKRYTHSTLGKGFQVSFEVMDDDPVGAISRAAPALARVAKNSIETDAFAVFNNGFSSETTPDGVALFHNSHPLVGGGTADNLIAADLSQSSIESAINLYNDMRDDRNQLIEGSPAILGIPPELIWRAHELLKSELRADTTDNATNALRVLSPLEPVMSKYLTDDDNWFVLSQPDDHEILYFWRQEPFSDSAIDFDTQNMKTAMFYRSSRGASDWRNTVGGQGQ